MAPDSGTIAKAHISLSLQVIVPTGPGWGSQALRAGRNATHSAP
jgi:hypothetical protein